MKQKCESCPTKLDCVSAFGIYWSDKSRGGVGCDYPFKYRRAAAPEQDGDGSVKGLPGRGVKWL